MRSSCLLCPLIFAATLSAHDFYLLPETFRVRPGTKVEIGIHNGDSFPASEVAPSLARLKEAQLESATGKITVRDLKIDGSRAVGIVDVPARSGGNAILSAHTAPNFLSLAPAKFLDYLKEEGLTDVIEQRSKSGETQKPSRERYSKFAKSLLISGAPDEFYKQSVGFPIEISPEANPYTLHEGSDLPVRIMFRGKPAAGLQVEAAWSSAGQSKTVVIGRTDAAGRIRVPLAAAGKWRLHSVFMERCSEPAAADWESYWASLTFEIQ